MAKGKAEKEASRRKEESAVMLVIIVIVVGLVFYYGLLNPKVEPGVSTNAPQAKKADSIPPPTHKNTKPVAISPLNVGDTVHYNNYPQGRGWSGVIVSREKENYTLKIVSVNTGAPLIYSLYPSECTGDQKIGPASVGGTLIVPVSCFK